jgi:hypothetical protein
MLDGSYWSRRLSGAFVGCFSFGDFGALADEAGSGAAVCVPIVRADGDVVRDVVATPGELDPTTGTTGETASCGRIPTKSPTVIAATALATARA